MEEKEIQVGKEYMAWVGKQPPRKKKVKVLDVVKGGGWHVRYADSVNMKTTSVIKTAAFVNAV